MEYPRVIPPLSLLENRAMTSRVDAAAAAGICTSREYSILKRGIKPPLSCHWHVRYGQLTMRYWFVVGAPLAGYWYAIGRLFDLNYAMQLYHMAPDSGKALRIVQLQASGQDV